MNRELKLIKALEKYLDLIREELDETATIASAHGWRSSRIEEGMNQRKEIDRLKDEHPELLTT